MIFKSPGDVLFNIGSFPVYCYGVTLAIASFVGVLVAYKVFKTYNPKSDYDKIWDFAAYLLILGFLGARFYYCLLNPVYYFQNPIEILDFREGGLSIHGGIITGVISAIFLARKYKLPMLKLVDAFICGTALAQSIGRWGNFFNSEAFGYPTNLPWKLYIPYSQRPDIYSGYEFFHPTFLYESILDFCIFVILLLVMKKTKGKLSGLCLSLYLIMYAVTRFMVESFRIDSALNIGKIPIAQLMSLVLLIIGVIGVVIIKKNCKKVTNLEKI